MDDKLKSISFIIVLCFSFFIFSSFAISAEEVKIPIIHVKGNHYQVGYQIGTYMKKQLKELIKQSKEDYIDGPDMKWKDIRTQTKLFLEYSKKYMPEYVEEIRGAADATGIDLIDLFSDMCEEIFSEGYSGGCSDLVACGDVTADGSVLIAHNNDTSAELEKYAVVVHYQVEGEPEILALSYGGLGISIGLNSAGISLTGNELSMNDMKIGVPRLLLCRKILASKTLGQAIDAAIFQPRASNYNMIITDHNGEIYNIEGSATDYEIIYPTDGYLAHTNHYVSPKMQKYELDKKNITESIIRYNRANRLMKKNSGKITIDTLKNFLKDHVNLPDSICSHGEYKTTASAIINLSTKTMFLSKGNPCQSKYYKYTF